MQITQHWIIGSRESPVRLVGVVVELVVPQMDVSKTGEIISG
jgi:hypothetical protein